jgi:hypothetical protein
LSLLCACTGLDTLPVDFQVDVLDAQPQEVAKIRLCLPGVLYQSQGAREADPLYLLRGPNVASDGPLIIELLGAEEELIAQANVPELAAYVTTRLDSCENGECEPCEAPEGIARVGEDTWALAVRFLR